MGSSFDLLAIGLVSTVIAILGFIVFVNNRKSITNKTFLSFTLLTIVYATFNFMSNQTGWSPFSTLWFLRLTIFFAVWHAFSIYYLFLVFPNEKQSISVFHKITIWLITTITAVLTLTPYVFEQVEHLPSATQVAKATQGPALPIFSLVSLGLVIAAIIELFKKARRATGVERTQYKLIFAGTILTFSLVLTCNLILPTVYEILTLIPFAPLFFFPFIIFTAYAIFKHHLFNVKVVATEVITFALWITLLIRAATAQGLNDILVGSAIFVASIALGILLIKSVLQEVKSREQVQRLALDLEIANRDLKRLDEAKSDFISIASHQLRTPLSIIKGYISMVREGTYGPVDKNLLDPLHKVYVSNERLINLVSDLLDLSRMERGRMQYQFEVIHLSDVVEGLVDDFAVVAKNKGLAFEWKKNDTKDVIKGDPNKLRQVVLNLIDNAIKYTPAGKITVSTSQEGQTVVLSVTDTGPGLSADESHALFKKFSRGREEKSMHTEGTGLGLYVAKLIAQAHGGDLSVTSPGKGLGSTFSLAVPLYNDSQEKIETFVSNL